MTAAYTTFANKGVYVKPKLYTKVLDHDGNVILDNTENESTQVIRESTAWLMTSALHTVVTSGTLRNLGFPTDMYVSGKSGTSQNDFDKWAIGFPATIQLASGPVTTATSPFLRKQASHI